MIFCSLHRILNSDRQSEVCICKEAEMKNRKTEILYFDAAREIRRQDGRRPRRKIPAAEQIFRIEYPAHINCPFPSFGGSGSFPGQETGRNEGKEHSIDLQMTGSLLRLRLRRAGVSVKQVQKALGLECPQSIYRWLSGQALPSVENLYTLHRLLGCHMEDLLLTKDHPLRMRCAAYMIAI